MENQEDTAQEHGLKPGVTVIIDDKGCPIRRGSWVVRELKAALGVDAVITDHPRMARKFVNSEVK